MAVVSKYAAIDRDLSATVLYEVMGTACRMGGFLPPAGYNRWEQDAITEVAHDFLTQSGRLATIRGAVDDEGLRRLLRVAVSNYLRDRARRTARGRMMRSLRRVIDADASVVSIPGQPGCAPCWALQGHARHAPFAGRVGDLIQAAFAVQDVRGAVWPHDAKSRPPIAQSESVRRVARAVLACAAAPVTRATMLEVVVARFPLGDAAKVVPLSECRGSYNTSTDATSARLIAWEIWAGLSKNQRLVAGLLHEPVRYTAFASGLSRGTASRTVIATKRLLAERLADVEEVHAVLGELRALSDSCKCRTMTGEAGAEHGSRREIVSLKGDSYRLKDRDLGTTSTDDAA